MRIIRQMQIDNTLFNDLLLRAATSPRLRVNCDLRYSEAEGSQRMLNALMPGTIISYPPSSNYDRNSYYSSWVYRRDFL